MKKNNSSVEGPDGLVYAARLPLSSATLNWLADLIRGHLKKIGSRWRALPAGKIATIVLAVLRCDQRPGDLAGGAGVHRTTVTRWVREVIGLLAARAPRLDRALKKIARMGGGMTDDLHQSHLPATSTSIPIPTHTSAVTSNFSLRTSQLGSGGEQPQPPTAAAIGKPRSMASGSGQRDGGGAGRPAPVAVTSSPHRSLSGCWTQDRPSETGRGLGHRR